MSSPMEKLAEVERLRSQADELEAQAFLEAFEQAEGLVKRAAELLGMHRSSFRRLIDPGGRHEEVGRAAEEMRRATGYTFGKPKFNSV